jgi:hypothetical protein
MAQAMPMPAFAPGERAFLVLLLLLLEEEEEEEEEGGGVDIAFDAPAALALTVGVEVPESVSTTAVFVAEAWKQTHALLISAAWNSDT